MLRKLINRKFSFKINKNYAERDFQNEREWKKLRIFPSENKLIQKLYHELLFLTWQKPSGR